MSGITSYGAYVPMYRLSREVIGKIWGGRAGGEKAVANYDEDSLTMAVEAGRDCLRGIDPKTIDLLYFASTTFPYREKQSAATIAVALDLKRDLLTVDFGNSLRSGTNAIQSALDAVNSGSAKRALVCAADMRLGHPMGGHEMSFGDGAAAFLIGDTDIAATVEGSYFLSNEFIDIWRTEEDKFVHSWEERFIREEGYFKVVPEAISAALNKYNLAAKDFTKFVSYSPDARQVNTVARQLGFDSKTQVQNPLWDKIGNTGVAQALISLVATIEEAKPGDKILLAGYGDGCDVFILNVTEQIENARKDKRGVKGHLEPKLTIKSYERYLRWRGLIDTQPPARPRFERPSAAALAVVADKSVMRRTLQDADLPVPEFVVADTETEVVSALERWPHAVLKLARGGYDGRGVFVVRSLDEASAVARPVLAAGGRFVIEPLLPLDAEMAVIVARRPGGESVVYDPVTTIQVDGMCSEVIAPALVSTDHRRAATELSLNQPAIAPLGEALPNTEIFRRLAHAMGLENRPGLADSDEALIRQMLDSDHPWLGSVTYERLERDTWARLAVTPGHRPNVDRPPDTPHGRLVLGPLAYRAAAPATDGFPLALLTRKQHLKFLNANYGGFTEHLPTEGVPTVHLDPTDAAARGIEAGDRVRVTSERGRLTLTAALSDDLQAGLAAIPFGWWNGHTPEGRSVNVLTNPTPPADGPGSAAFHDTWVEVERLAPDAGR